MFSSASTTDRDENGSPIACPRTCSFTKTSINRILNVRDPKDMEVSELISKLNQGHRFLRVQSNGKLCETDCALSDDASMIDCDKHKVLIGSITEVRPGQGTTSFHKITDSAFTSKEFVKRSFSIIYSVKYTLDLIAPTERIAELWTVGLGELRTIDSEKTVEVKTAARYWKAVAGADTELGVNEMMKLLKQMGIKPKKSHVKRLLKKVDADHSRTLSFLEFIMLLRQLRSYAHIDDLFYKYSNNNVYLTPKEFLRFLNEEQDETHIRHEKHAVEMIEQFQPRKVLDLDGEQKEILREDVVARRELPLGIECVLYRTEFQEYIASPSNSLLNPSMVVPYQKMTQPLSHYWLASSHNTYLTGDQLTSKSSVEMYISALKRGCKCVELDCWDGDEEPVIYHGKTLTSKLTFSSVCTAIKNYAFYHSGYPVILSIENHCSRDQQQIMAVVMKGTFGTGESGMLATPIPVGKEASGAGSESGRQSGSSSSDLLLPSPEDLKYKILIKMGTDGQSSTELRASGNKPSASAKTHPDLADLVYLRTKTFKDFVDAQLYHRCDNIVSFDENKVADLAHLEEREFVHFNKRQMSRVYPKGTRFDSSNYDPFPAWNVGCQIVALNYQTAGFEMYMNEGRFRINGRTGYVLKPECLVGGRPFAPTKVHRTPSTSRYLSAAVTVISARQLPSSGGGDIPDSKVVVVVAGLPQDRQEMKTKVVANNGFNPEWNERFEFKFVMSELAVITFCVQEKDKIGRDTLGYYSLPVEAMRSGYRVLPMYDSFHQRIPGFELLVMVELEFNAEYGHKSRVKQGSEFFVTKEEVQRLINATVAPLHSKIKTMELEIRRLKGEAIPEEEEKDTLSPMVRPKNEKEKEEPTIIITV